MYKSRNQVVFGSKWKQKYNSTNFVGAAKAVDGLGENDKYKFIFEKWMNSEKGSIFKYFLIISLKRIIIWVLLCWVRYDLVTHMLVVWP